MSETTSSRTNAFSSFGFITYCIVDRSAWKRALISADLNDVSEIFALDSSFQGFNWESAKNKKGWYNVMAKLGEDVKAAGFTDVWLPPPSQSVAPQGMSSDFKTM